MLKQTEIFAFLAAFFLVLVVLLERPGEPPDPEPPSELPPIIILGEDKEEYRFELGSSDPSPEFREALRSQIIPLLDSFSVACNCDAVEVIGHTDGVPVAGNYSTLDLEVLRRLQQGAVDSLRPGSNLDLGMMRALNVVRLLQEAQEAGALTQVRFFRPYSAGQLLLREGHLAQSDEYHMDRQRRRIEIRLLQFSVQSM